MPKYINLRVDQETKRMLDEIVVEVDGEHAPAKASMISVLRWLVTREYESRGLSRRRKKRPSAVA